MPGELTPQLATQLADLPVAEALARLEEESLLQPESAVALARFALPMTEGNPPAAQRLVDLAAALHERTGAQAQVVPWLAYARARLALVGGDFAGAEAALQEARTRWQALGEPVLLARSGLGLTQVLAVQGRYADAQAVVSEAVDALAAIPDRDVETELIYLDARINAATLLSYQEQHAEAAAEFAAVQAALAALLESADDNELAAELRARLGLVGIDAAISQTYLDNPVAAAATLTEAIALLDQPEVGYDRGRAHSNLGHLLTRTGSFAGALGEFDAATLDMLGTSDPDSAPERWDGADVLFLDHAIVQIALNLLPEATANLDRALVLFERSGQRYELGQALYYRALAALRELALGDAGPWLAQAAAIFAELGNDYWLNRVRQAEALARLLDSDAPSAAALLDALLVSGKGAAAPSAGDLVTRVEGALLRSRVALAQAENEMAMRWAEQAATWLNEAAAGREALSLYPHLALLALHARGQAARAAGDTQQARQFFEQAVDVIESQRATLPVEEFRTAFLADKTQIYADLVLSLLDTPAPPESMLADAFAVVERARSRALLERLLAAVDEAALAQSAQSPETGERLTALRRRLAWLYNQLLGNNPAGRGLDGAITDEIRAAEASLQRLEWRVAPWLAEAEPATLDTVQQALAQDEQAVIYYQAGNEWMAFVVGADDVYLARHLCTARAVEQALADLRFQLGRAEIGDDYLARHGERLMAGARGALRQLHDLLWAPLRGYLKGRRLLVIPHGPLHLAPFHAFWDGTSYLAESCEVSYAPSASVELHRRKRAEPAGYASLVGFAVRDPSIPQAEAEIRAAGACFDTAQLFVDDDARVDVLQQAAADGDVLHLATHGLFRPDNPYFSALKLADGWIDVRSIYRLPLRARLVVLSACESGAVQVQGGDEAIGLVRGFLGAGAQSLVVSLWNVHDASAAAFMTDFYKYLQNAAMAPATALRAAQQRAIQANRHPYFWAPYTAIG